MSRATTNMSDSGRVQIAGRRLHFVGIGGCGMSGLARMTAARGAVCSGSDRVESDTLRALRDAGLAVSLEQTAEALPSDVEMLVVSAAIPEAHPERMEARRRGLQVIKYAELLGQLMRGRAGIAIAGTHGKSTTTSILCHVLISAGLDPSFIVGANCEQIGGGWRVADEAENFESGKAENTEILIAEACEYDRSFHNFFPTHATILNVEADHLDLYSGIEEIIEAFAVFARRVPDNGSLLIQHESPHRLAITAGLVCDVETIGFAPQADWRLTRGDDARWTLHHDDQAVLTYTSPMPGDHFAYNAGVAAVTAHRLGAAWPDIADAVGTFQGLDRRMQQVGTLPPNAQGPNNIRVIDDYGHHPTEIDTTLRALRQHHDPTRLICVFQPHQHSRTRHLMEQFAVSFSEADIVIVPEIYFVRDSEDERRSVTSGDLVEKLRAQGVTAMHVHPFEAIVEQLQVMVHEGDLIVTMGAGDVWKIGRAFLDAEAG